MQMQSSYDIVQTRQREDGGREFRRTELFRDALLLEARARQWREALTRTGWRPSAIARVPAGPRISSGASRHQRLTAGLASWASSPFNGVSAPT